MKVCEMREGQTCHIPRSAVNIDHKYGESKIDLLADVIPDDEAGPADAVVYRISDAIRRSNFYNGNAWTVVVERGPFDERELLQPVKANLLQADPFDPTGVVV